MKNNVSVIYTTLGTSERYININTTLALKYICHAAQGRGEGIKLYLSVVFNSRYTYICCHLLLIAKLSAFSQPTFFSVIFYQNIFIVVPQTKQAPTLSPPLHSSQRVGVSLFNCYYAQEQDLLKQLQQLVENKIIKMAF